MGEGAEAVVVVVVVYINLSRRPEPLRLGLKDEISLKKKKWAVMWGARNSNLYLSFLHYGQLGVSKNSVGSTGAQIIST
jgi:hypothetical protein